MRELVYTAVHKLGSRDNDVQEKLRAIELAICRKYGVAVADVYGQTDLDTNDVNKKNDYTFDSLGANGLPGNNGSGTHPNLKAIEEFYVPVVTEALKDPASHIPEVEVPPTVDKTVLETKLNEAKAEAAKVDVYTENSIAKLNKVIQDAEAVFHDENAKQDQVNAQISALEEAMEALVLLIDEAKENLAALIAQAEVVKEDVYTAESLAELQQAIETAQRVLDDMTAGQEAIDEQTELVNTALKNLVKQEIPSADRTALDAKLNEARVEAEKTDIYTADSIAYLNQVIAEVENTAAAENLTQEQIDGLTVKLEEAIKALARLPKPTPDVIDRSGLSEKISEAEKLSVSENIYTEESMEVLKQAINAAKDIYAYPNASQEDIDAQVSALQAEIDSLEIADSVKPETPDEGEQGTGDSENPEEKPDSVIQQPENSSGNEDHDSTINTNKGNTPKTGDRTNVKVLAVTGGIALVVILSTVVIMLRKKRR